MEQSHFALSWEEHMQHVSNGLSLLQQNGEFVDMTLAADGHHVKVHQVIIALSSPFLKDLISSAKCTHPVIFLSKISHATLSALLEYMYTGEVLVAIEDLNELIDAAKELHIKGLQEMTLSQALASKRDNNTDKSSERFSPQMEYLKGDQNITYYEISDQIEDSNTAEPESIILTDVRTIDDDDNDDNNENKTAKKQKIANKNIPDFTDVNTLPNNLGTLQYTISNQGSLQMILNRFIYYLKHTNRDTTRQWRCVEYLNTAKCPAYVFTKDDVVVQRILAHNHPFHDKKIWKKVKAGCVYTAIQEAEKEGTLMKNKDELKESEINES